MPFSVTRGCDPVTARKYCCRATGGFARARQASPLRTYDASGEGRDLFYGTARSSGPGSTGIGIYLASSRVGVEGEVSELRRMLPGKRLSDAEGTEDACDAECDDRAPHVDRLDLASRRASGARRRRPKIYEQKGRSAPATKIERIGIGEHLRAARAQARAR